LGPPAANASTAIGYGRITLFPPKELPVENTPTTRTPVPLTEMWLPGITLWSEAYVWPTTATALSSSELFSPVPAVIESAFPPPNPPKEVTVEVVSTPS